MKQAPKPNRADAALMAEKRRNRAGHAQLRRRGGFHESRGYHRDRQKSWRYED